MKGLLYLGGVLAFSGGYIFCAESSTTISSDAQATLLSQIQKAVDGISSLTFSGEIQRSSWDNEKREWIATPLGRRFKVTRSGPASNQGKLEYEDTVTEWQGGAAPYFQEVYSLAFNGSFGTTARFKIGALGKAEEYKVGTIVNGVPEEFSAYRIPFADDALFALSRLQVGERPRIVEWLERGKLDSPGVKVLKIANMEGNENSIEILVDDTIENGWREEIIVNPQNGWIASKKLWSKTPGSEKLNLLSEMIATQVKEIAPGIAIPTQIEYTYYDDKVAPTTPKSRDIFILEDIELNTASRDDFTITFEPGFVVEDERVGTRIIVGREPKIVAEKIKKDIKSSVDTK